MNIRNGFISCLSLASFVVAGEVASAYNFNDKFYGKVGFTLGYSFEKVTGTVWDWEKNDKGADGMKLHNFDLSLSYNVYWKATDFIHPFLGLEFTGRVPLKNKIRDVTKQFNHFSFDLKGGIKFNHIRKSNISVQVYDVIGLAYMERYNDLEKTNAMARESGVPEFEVSWSRIHERVPAFNYGAGIDVIYDFSNKISFIGGVEYKHVRSAKTKYTGFHLETNQVELKIGVQFL